MTILIQKKVLRRRAESLIPGIRWIMTIGICIIINTNP
jgi:hypothetical protein